MGNDAKKYPLHQSPSQDTPSCDAGRTAEQRYRQLLKAIPDLIFRIRRDGTFLDYHAPDDSQLWFNPEDFLGKRIAEVFPPEMAQQCMEVIERTFAEGHMQTCEYDGIDSGRDERWEMRMTICGPDEVLAVKREITDQKRLEEDLQRRERFLRSMFEAAVDPLWDWDVVKDRAVLSPSWPRMLGYEPHEFDPVVQTWSSRLHPDDKPHVWAALEACVRGEQDQYEAEYRVQHRSGRWLWAVSRGRVVERGPKGEALRMVGSIRDMTERREAEDARREHERFLTTLLSNLPGHAYRCRNDRHWTLEYVSEGIEATTGYPMNEFLSENARSYGDLIVEDDRERIWSEVQQAIARHKPFQLTYQIRRADGSLKWMWEQGRAVVNDKGEVSALEGFVTDITSRVEAEEEARRGEERQRVLLRELDHRVRNNLASLAALIDISSRGAKSVDELAASIRSRVQAMSTTHVLLTRSHLSPLDVRGLIAALIPPEMIYSVSLSGPDVVVATRQSTAFGMVIQEILTNSMKYGSLSALGGRVEVRWEVLEEANQNGTVMLELTWQECGGPPVPQTVEPGVGTTLINGLVRAELRGSAELCYPEDGACHRLVLRLDSWDD